MSKDLDKLVSRINRDIVDFYRAQKLGFYRFKPYEKDFIYNLDNFLTHLFIKHGKDNNSVFLEGIGGILWIPKMQCFEVGFYFSDKLGNFYGNVSSDRKPYLFYPDCIKFPEDFMADPIDRKYKVINL